MFSLISGVYRKTVVICLLSACFFYLQILQINAQVYNGSFTGNGTSLAITAPGFQPDMVILKRSGANEAQIKFAGMGLQTRDLCNNTGTSTTSNNRITSLDATGFSVGSEAIANGSSATHHYIAFKAIAGQIAIGSYTGNGADNRNITGLGLTPDYVLICGGTTETAWRTSLMAGDASVGWVSAGSDAQPNNIQSIISGGFQVGTDNRVNQSGVTYYYIAAINTTGKITVGTHTGNGIDNRNITGFGFQPGFLAIKRSDGTTTGAFKTSSTGNNTDITLIANATVDAADNIQALLPDGMQLGVSGRANGNGFTYQWVAFADNAQWPASITLNSINRTNSSPTNSNTVQFTITFAGSVSGVTASNFGLTTSGVTGASITGVSGSGTTWTVTVNTGSGNGTIRLDMNNSTGISSSINNIPYTSGQVYTIYKTSGTGDYYRTRNTSGNWSTITDWESSSDNSFYVTASAIPTFAATLVTIQNGHTITLNGVDPTISSLAINGIININGRTLTINNITGTGTLTGSTTSNLSIGGTGGGSAGTLYFTSGSNSLNDFIINRTGTTPSVTLGNTLDMYGTLTPTSGTVNTGGNLVLKSNAAGTARIAAGSSLGGYVNGNVTIERYIPANGNRAWRLLGAPVTIASAPTIFNSWQEAGASTSGFGTHITKAGGAGTNGFDASTISNASSIRHWNGLALQAPSNTNTTTVGANGGAYFLFVRGDRTINLNNNTVSGNTTLRMSGVPNQGDVNNVGSAGNDYSLIPNPYPSAVDFELVRSGNGSSINTFYSWDATLNNVGAYRTVERLGTNNYQQTPSGGSVSVDATARYIQSGQAFFIPVNATMNFTESMKTVSAPSFNVFRTTAGGEELVVNLSIADGAGWRLADGLRIKYDAAYSLLPSSEDIIKLANFNENLSVLNNGLNLVVEKRPVIVSTDTIDLNLWNTSINNYRFSFDPINFSGTMVAWLIDNYLNTVTTLDLTNPSDINFSITAATASSASNRFQIVFDTQAPLYSNNILISGRTEQQGVKIKWQVNNEAGLTYYEVERSDDGQIFKLLGVVEANKDFADGYSFWDNQTITNERYYRIKGIYNDGKIIYSRTIKLTSPTTTPEIVIYPNPITGKVIVFQWSYPDNGNYKIIIRNIHGEQIVTTSIFHKSNNESYRIDLGRELPAGTYSLSIVNKEGKEISTQKVLVTK